MKLFGPSPEWIRPLVSEVLFSLSVLMVRLPRVSFLYLKDACFVGFRGLPWSNPKGVISKELTLWVSCDSNSNSFCKSPNYFLHFGCGELVLKEKVESKGDSGSIALLSICILIIIKWIFGWLLRQVYYCSQLLITPYKASWTMDGFSQSFYNNVLSAVSVSDNYFEQEADLSFLYRIFPHFIPAYLTYLKYIN